MAHEFHACLQGQQAGPAQQALQGLRPAHGLAQGLGPELGRGPALLRRLPPRHTPPWLSRCATWCWCWATS
ncbi:MAG: hypothetical protein V4795_06275 [Pseudomonadota bacterium]